MTPHASSSSAKGTLTWQTFCAETRTTRVIKPGIAVSSPHPILAVQESKAQSAMSEPSVKRIFHRTVIPGTVGKHTINDNTRHCSTDGSSISKTCIYSTEKPRAKDMLMVIFAPSHRLSNEAAHTRLSVNTSSPSSNQSSTVEQTVPIVAFTLGVDEKGSLEYPLAKEPATESLDN